MSWEGAAAPGGHRGGEDTGEHQPRHDTADGPAEGRAEVARHYIKRLGLALVEIPDGEKGPIGKGWVDHPIQDPEQFRGRCNLGVVHWASGTCSLDIDDIEQARKVLDDAGIDMDVLLATHNHVVARGRRILFRLPEGSEDLKKTAVKQDGTTVLEFRAGRHQDVLPPSMHPSGQPYVWSGGEPPDALRCMPDELVAYWKRLLARKKPAATTESTGHRSAQVDLDELEDALTAITEDDYDTWREVGQALHDTDAGTLGFELWDEWSRNSDKHPGPDAMRAKWQSFHVGGGLTYRSIFAKARAHGWKPKQKRRRKPKAETPKPAQVDAFDTQPVILVADGALARLVRQSAEALSAAGTDLYRRGEALVRPLRLTQAATTDGVRRPAGALTLVMADAPWIRLRLADVAAYERYDRRRKAMVETDPPATVAHTLAAVPDAAAWPHLHAVVAHPVLRADGQWIGSAGYHDGLLVDIAGQWPEPQSTRAAAEAALARLRALLRHYRWATPADEAVALSLLLTAVMRAALDVAPGQAVDAPTRGAGKSLLVDVAAILATGAPAPVMDYTGDPTEADKRLDAMLLAGDAVIAIDNIERPLEGASLCQTLSQTTRRVRVLGASKMVTVPCTALVAATGNNIVVRGDMTRRMVVCRIDPMVERPELRDIPQDLRAEALADRPELVAACHTIVRARMASADARPVPLGGYIQWSRLVRDALVWLGLPDPVSTMDRLRVGDPAAEAHAAVAAQWHRALGDTPVTANQAIRHAEGDSALREALEAVCQRRGTLDAVTLGRWLGRHVDRRTGEYAIRKHVGRAGSAQWAVESGGVGGVGGDVSATPLWNAPITCPGR